MPRKSRHHGNSIKERSISKEQLCVPCAVNRTGKSIAQASNVGHIRIKELHAVFDGKISDTAELCTDKMSSYKTFAKEIGVSLHQFKAEERSKGIYGIQHINNYHSVLKLFMYKFRGVSSKYLNNYLVWNNFVNQVGETYTEKRVIMLRYCLAYPQEIQGTTVRNRVPLPVVA